MTILWKKTIDPVGIEGPSARVNMLCGETVLAAGAGDTSADGDLAAMGVPLDAHVSALATITVAQGMLSAVVADLVGPPALRAIAFSSSNAGDGSTVRWLLTW